MKENNHTTQQNTFELLAPAGSLAIFKAVVAAGADAVYVGGSKFGARAYADNFSDEELVRFVLKSFPVPKLEKVFADVIVKAPNAIAPTKIDFVFILMNFKIIK